jgi:hypothetical protein
MIQSAALRFFGSHRPSFKSNGFPLSSTSVPTVVTAVLLNMYSSLILSFLTSVALGSPTQQPLRSFHVQEPLAISEKNLISSKALQHDIKADNLLKRAESLYDIAKSSLHQYNHPTRVIGSAGL